MAEADSSHHGPQGVEDIDTKGIVHWNHHTSILQAICAAVALQVCLSLMV
jgi:hypothetical protein